MKTVFARVLPVLLFCASATFSAAGDFQSAVLSTISGTPSITITVPAGRFLVIRNFTQDGGSIRGEITATLQPSNLMATVLTTSFVNTTPVEVINNVVVAGPASVSVTCPDSAAKCFITYRKGDD